MPCWQPDPSVSLGVSDLSAFSWDTAAAGRCNEATVCVHAYVCVRVCVSGQCLASSKFKLNLNEFLCVLGYGNCRNRLHTVTRQ